MEDIQSRSDRRDVPLERVGIARLALPMMILEKSEAYQHVVAECSLMVEVPADVRGAHLSRFVEVVTEWANRPVSSSELRSLLEETRRRSGSVSAEAEIRFTYFLPRSAPVSGMSGFLDYMCEFHGRLDGEGYEFILGAEVPITTLCPCSRAISEVGAHNQRATLEAKVCYADGAFIWLEDLIASLEAQASCPVFPILKRADEKYVTETAYENAKFVEDVVRDAVLSIERMSDVVWCAVRCESVESIHNHNAFASAERVFAPSPRRADVPLANAVRGSV
jgi:GTP cyclohydrolase I